MEISACSRDEDQEKHRASNESGTINLKTQETSPVITSETSEKTSVKTRTLKNVTVEHVVQNDGETEVFHTKEGLTVKQHRGTLVRVSLG